MEIFSLQIFNDNDRGKLLPIDFQNLNFFPVRNFIVFDVAPGTIRGNHAHINSNQILLCVKGEILIRTFCREGEREIILKPGEYFLLEKMTWASQEFITGNDFLCVFCDSTYNRNDYIEYINIFKKEIEKNVK